MTNKSYIPILAVLGAIMLVVVAAIAPPQSFFGRDLVHAQAVTDDATLSALSLSDALSTNVPLSPVFDESDRRVYSARVLSGINKVTVTATANNPLARVTFSPLDQDSVLPGHQVLLTGGQERVVTVTVRSEDGTVTERYTITIYRVRTTPSANANLSSLSLNGVRLSPAFTSSTTIYRGRAAYSTEETTVSYGKDIGAEVAISATPASAAAVPMDADADASGYQVDLPTAGIITTITVTVTAEGDGPDEGDTARDEKIYTISVYRENLVKSDNASLAAANGLTLGYGPITTSLTSITLVNTAAGVDTYAATTKSYPDVRVVNDARTVTVATDTAHDGAVAVTRPSDQDTETDGHQVNLSAGAKTNITVDVTAEDGTTTDTYSVTIYRARRTPSTDADLSALSLSSVTLSPAFASDKDEYTGRVGYNTDEITVSYTADVGAMVGISAQVGAANAVAEDADTNAPGHQVNLGPGVVTTITVTVTPEDTNGTAKPYMVDVYRENLVRSDDPSLAATDGLTLGHGPIASLTSITLVNTAAGVNTYAATTKSYPDVRVPTGVDAVTVATDTEDDGAVAVITPSDQDSLTDGHQVILGAGAKTNITVHVTAEDGTTTDTYSVTIYRGRTQLSGDADLSVLSLSGVTLSSAFASDKDEYTGRAPYRTEQTTVSYTADVGAMVGISAQVGAANAVAEDADTNAPGHQVDLGPGVVTTITVTVTPEDTNGTAKPYMVDVYRENLPPFDNASLATANGLVLSDGPLNDDGTASTVITSFTYGPAIKSYPNVRVVNAVQTITIAANTAQAGAVAVITPSDQDSLTGGHQVILGAAAKTNITVEVTAEDGITTDTYSITIYRGRRTQSTDADLSVLSLSGVTLSPAFASDKPKYIGSAAYGIEMITVSYTADIGAMVAIHDGSDEQGAFDANPADSYKDADPAVPGHQVLLLSTGQATVITVTVRAEDGATTTVPPYTITVYRDAAPSSDASLQSLALSGIMLSPAFDPATTEYTAEAENIESTTVEAIPAHLGATVEGDGPQSLTAGVENTISVTVTAEDGTSETYTVKVTVPSSDATLQTLELSGITLSPAFNPATMMYTGEVGFTVRTTTVEATATHPDATVSEGTGETPLSEGQNTISVTVTAEDGTSQETYTVMVTVTAERSSVATLQALDLSGIALSPAFDPATTTYTAEVEYTVETTTVEAMTTHPGATVEGDGEKSLSEGDNTFIVTVTAEDGTSQETYTVTVIVGEAPPVEGDLLGRYDADDSGDIDKSEAIAAINDYLFGEGDQQITKAQAIEVINLYLFP